MDANDIARTGGTGALRKTFDAAVTSAQPPSAPSETGGRVELWTPAQYRARHAEPPGYLVDGLLRSGTLAAIGSRPGHGKTALLVELAKCVSTGTPFLGRDTKRAAVAYFAPEDPHDVLNRMEATGTNALLPEFKYGFDLTRQSSVEASLREALTKLRGDDPSLPAVFIIDTLRAAIGDASVLEDRSTAPALNMLRRVAEEEDAVMIVANHTNRENPRATKGETLEAVAALELVLLPGEGEWFNISVGKNRSGPGGRVIGQVKYKSVPHKGMHAAVVDEIRHDGAASAQKQKLGGNQRLFLKAFDAVMSHGSKPFRPSNNKEAVVKAVKQNSVASRFAELKPTASRETVRKGFARALDGAMAEGKIAYEVDNAGETWLWRCTQ